MPVYPTGTKVTQPQWERLIGATPTSYTVFKKDSRYYAECNIPGGTDYSGTDPTTVIQAAIDAGGKIFIKAATYTLPSKISLKDNVVLQGESWNTIFTVSGGYTDYRIIEIPSGCDNAVVANLKIVGGGVDANGITVDAGGVCENNAIIRCWVDNASHTAGICVAGTNTLVRDCLVTNIASSVSSSACIWVTSRLAFNVKIEDCTAKDSDVAGLVLDDRPRNTTIINFKAKNVRSGIAVSSPVAEPRIHYTKIINPTVIESWRGIQVTYSRDVLILGGTILCNGYNGIYLSQVRDILVKGVTIKDNSQLSLTNYAGIYIDGASRDVVVKACPIKTGIDTGPLTQNAAATQKVVHTECIHKFFVGQHVIIEDDTPLTENNVIATLDPLLETITMENNLANTYTTAQNARVDARASQTPQIHTAGTTDYVQIVHNLLELGQAKPWALVQVVGSNNIVRYNNGFITENSGTATIPNGTATTGNVAHGLAGTPTIVMTTGRDSDTEEVRCSSRDGTNIVLSVTGNVGGDRTVDWYVEYKP